MNDRDYMIEKAKLGITRSVAFNGRLYINSLKRTYPWLTDQEVGRIVDELVSSAVVKREFGKKRGEQLVRP
jgi:hypothetical protein